MMETGLQTQLIDNAQEVFVSSRAAGPRLGFLGVGWIGMNRLKSIAESGTGEVYAFTEPDPQVHQKISEIAPDARMIGNFDDLLASEIDGLVIATPSSMHAEQAFAALEAGISVFCQKPLAINSEDTSRVVEAARRSDRLLSVDLSYRFIDGVEKIREVIQGGSIGNVFAIDLVFHNAYGPDKLWFYDRRLSGGGCLIDLGIHLLDLALWCMDFPKPTSVNSRLYAAGRPLETIDGRVEDFASVQIELANGALVDLTCSWDLHLGYDAEISAKFFGTEGGVCLKNVGGSFFDFTTETYSGTQPKNVDGNSERNVNWQWGGGAILNWVERLSKGGNFDPECEHLVEVARILDRSYRAGCLKRDSIF